MTRLPGQRRFSRLFTGILQEPPHTRSDVFRFVPALHPPDEAPRAALWFPFRGDQLLVHANPERAALLEYSNLATLGVDFEKAHYLGRLDDLDCYAVEVESDVEPAPEASFEGLRALYGRLPEDHYA